MTQTSMLQNETKRNIHPFLNKDLIYLFGCFFVYLLIEELFLEDVI